jgi:hypothetical protein
MNSSATVAAELSLLLVVPEHGRIPLTASLYYRGDDPYAIRMAFHVGLDDPVEWIFARDLLAAGLSSPCGEGDVRVWPETGTGPSLPGRHARPAQSGPGAPDAVSAVLPDGRAGVLNITLSSPFGQAHFQAPLAPLTGFLLRTFEVVPAGREGEFINIENELNTLLS